MSLAQRPNPARELTVAATNRLDDLPDCVDHKFRIRPGCHPAVVAFWAGACELEYLVARSG
jgi:hypothetical protein